MSGFWASDFVHPQLYQYTDTRQPHADTMRNNIYSSSRPSWWSQGPDIHDFVINNPIMQDVSHYSFTGNQMKLLEDRLLWGAEFDSSTRDPPPRCHPGTRLSIIQKIQRFLDDRGREKRMLWLVGPAGVGKSAIMQTLAETASNITLGASLFFAVNQRDDPSKVLPTLAYQIAIKYPPYRQFILQEITLDPLLPHKSMTKLFNKFFVEPFVRRHIYHGPLPLLIIIDGLDECEGESKQREILGLISYFCLAYPTAPLIWVISSRPEPQITTFLSLPKAAPSYVKEEMIIDSDEACRDVERYLRSNFEMIRTKYPALSLFSRWPAEGDFCKIAASSTGLFAFASTVIRHIDDPAGGNPVFQLQQVLKVIDYSLSRSGDGRPHPLAGLDALYDYIISLIPPDVLPTAKKLLLNMVWSCSPSFGDQCNFLGMGPDVAYGSLHHLHSVVRIYPPDQAFDEWKGTALRSHHKSFVDYLTDPARSTLFADAKYEGDMLVLQCMVRIMKDVPDDAVRDPEMHITLSWPCGDPEVEQDMRRSYFKFTSDILIDIVIMDLMLLRDPDIIHALKVSDISGTFQQVPEYFFELALGNAHNRTTLMAHQVIQEMPFRMLDLDKMAYQGVCSVIYRSKRPGAPLPPAFRRVCERGCQNNVRQKPSHEAKLGSPECLSRPPADPSRSVNTQRHGSDELRTAALAHKTPSKFFTRRTDIYQTIS
ncbi:hypothetical protein P691DRAFT_779852 [Macrolepiota fuliginosa MF-IS2]|uniref:NACHT domain-containing protein n=1 Tax=Macrolepiota fuliginosa MF-IS2 TaxID=1400762 RepID=A0A9P5X0X9_9AGAR|nr:hypothetical protein P691DRAFT_779852 [Macrolepiota fuliginosa MF-IS2]